MVGLVEVSFLEKSIHSILLIGLILLVRRYFNEKSIKWANAVLWTILLVYLLIPYSILIDIDKLSNYGIAKNILKQFITINNYAKLITVELGSVLSTINRILVGTLISIYIIYQFYKMKRALNYSVYVPKDNRIEACMNLFNFKRKIQILVNDNIKVPMTYGVIKPKIILQSSILQDDELLKYVLIHELTHIKKFDIVFSHIKNLITCLYWYNIFIIAASRYMEDDFEILCDKLVIQKVGDTNIHRKEYCLSLLKLMEEKDKKISFVLKMNPNMERMIVMKKWKKTLAGVMSFVMAAALSTTVFADINKSAERIIVSDEITRVEGTIENNQLSTNTYDEQIKVISDDEYNSLELGESLLEQKIGAFSADIDESETLSGLSNNKYSFDMKSWTEANHNAFAIKTSNMSCSSGVDYQIIIQKKWEGHLQ